MCRIPRLFRLFWLVALSAPVFCAGSFAQRNATRSETGGRISPYVGFGEAGELVGVDPIVGNMRRVPEGAFNQGSPEGEPCRDLDEGPVFPHTLTLALAVMETEVTRLMWATLEGFQPTLPDDLSDESASPGANDPVQRVTWYDAVVFANLLSSQNKLVPCYYKDSSFQIPLTAENACTGRTWCNFRATGYRLPTEAEWEYFCRAGTQTPFWKPEAYYSSTTCGLPDVPGLYPSLEEAAWFMPNSSGHTGTVGTRQANPWNICDVHGNVREWCWDWVWNYPSGAQVDYRGDSSGSAKAIRGGSWDLSAACARSANRWSAFPQYRSSSLGFRLVRTISLCPLPEITNQPYGPSSVCYRDRAHLHVDANGLGPFSYQWYLGGRGITLYPLGTNSPDLVTYPLTRMETFWVRVFSDCGYQDSETVKVDMMGDVNMDGIISAKDYTLMLDWFAGREVPRRFLESAMDANCDGAIDIMDLIKVFMIVQ